MVPLFCIVCHYKGLPFFLEKSPKTDTKSGSNTTTDDNSNNRPLAVAPAVGNTVEKEKETKPSPPSKQTTTTTLLPVVESSPTHRHHTGTTLDYTRDVLLRKLKQATEQLESSQSIECSVQLCVLIKECGEALKAIRNV